MNPIACIIVPSNATKLVTLSLFLGGLLLLTGCSKEPGKVVQFSSDDEARAHVSGVVYKEKMSSEDIAASKERNSAMGMRGWWSENYICFGVDSSAFDWSIMHKSSDSADDIINSTSKRTWDLKKADDGQYILRLYISESVIEYYVRESGLVPLDGQNNTYVEIKKAVVMNEEQARAFNGLSN